MTLEILRSDLLGDLPHGFFTRRGGASSGVFSGLNCGFGSSDQHEAVEINRARAAGALGLAPDRLTGVHQVHSAEAVTVAGPDDGGGRADALVTATPGLGLSVLTADCGPVLFADTQAGVIGAAHAGWKGAVGGVLEATIAAMERLGANASSIRAALGPTIGPEAYEVGPDFHAAVTDSDPKAARHFVPGTGDRQMFDLPGYIRARLESLGIAASGWTGHSTYADPERFYSYRRSVHRREADYGRLISIIALPTP